MVAQILTSHGDSYSLPLLEEGITLELSRKGMPGKLTFRALQDETVWFEEGDPVKFTVDGRDVFYGFIFSKAFSGSTHDLLEITAYDQLRYFKNKDTYAFTGKRADEILRMIAGDFGLCTGQIDNTGYSIPSLVEEDSTLFDIVQSALDETVAATGRMYVLYDDVGALCLRDIEKMKLPILLDADSVGNLSYSGSIDNSYNQIKLTHRDGTSGARSVYIARDSGSISRWGLLQYTDTVENAANGGAKADALLSLYNRKTRRLSLSDVQGDLRIRGGSSVICAFPMGDLALQNYLVVEKVVHTIKNNEHTMSLNMKGGGFSA